MTTVGNISQIQVGADSYNIGHSQSTSAILYGTVDSTSTATAFTATIDGLTSLVDGTTVYLRNTVVTSAAGFTVDINGLGAKKCYNNMTNATQDTTIFNIAYSMLFIYDSTLDSGNGGWWIYRGYDGNTNTIGYQLRGNSSTLPASDKGYRYRLWFTSADGTKWVPANKSSSTNATASRTPNTTPIDPFGPIVYYAANATTEANAVLTASNLWTQYTISLGYSFNTTGAALVLTFPAPVYVKCTPQANGSAVMDGYVQALPTSNDGKIYIWLGRAYSATNIELFPEHPVYYYDGSAIRLWTGKAIPTKVSELTNDSGFITDADIPPGAAKYTSNPNDIGITPVVGDSNAFSPGNHVHAITKATITSVLGSMSTAATGITVSDHSTTTITGVQSSTTSVTGVQATTTTASKITTTTVTIPNVTSAGTASNWVFEDIAVPIKDTAKTITGVTAAGSGSFTQGSFSGGSFTQGTDSFTTNVPTKIDTSKFNGGSYSHSGFSGGSFTQGTFNGGSGSFTQGSFSGGSLTMTIDGTDTKKLNIVFTAATHGTDSHTHNAATHGNDSYTSAVYGTDSFTAASLASGFYTAGATAAFTQGTDTFTPATHGTDSHTHVPPTLATAVTITGVQASTTTASHVKSGGNGSAPTLGTAITVTAVSGNTDVTVPIKATSATTVPIKNTATTTVVTSNTHTVNDSGHAHAY